MNKLSLLAIVTIVFLSSCATTSAPSYRDSVPIVVSLDVAPGYKHEMSLILPASKVIQLRVLMLSQSPSKKWKPTAYISLQDDTSDIVYNLNLTTDTDLQKQYVRSRVINLKEEKELSVHTHQELFSISSENFLKIEVKDRFVRSFVNGNLVEEIELPYEPASYDIGASSGSYRLSVIEEPPSPTSE